MPRVRVDSFPLTRPKSVPVKLTYTILTVLYIRYQATLLNNPVSGLNLMSSFAP